MLKAYKYRLYPTKGQTKKLNKTFGCVRFVWNNYVQTFNSYNKETNPKPIFKTSKELRTEFPFLKEISAATLQYKQRHFDQYKKNLFSKKIKDFGKPNFQSRKTHNSFSLCNSQCIRFVVDTEKSKIRIEKIGWVKFVCDRKLEEGCVLKNLTVSKDSCGHYWASVQFECQIEHLPKTGKTVGIDLGLKEFVVTSDNIHIDNPRYFAENQSKIARLQMWQSKKVGSKKGEKKSNRWLKNQKSINKCYWRLTNQRKDFLHNLTTKLVREYDIICLEDLNVKGMMQNHKLAKSIGDVSWSMFNIFLQYKADWYGKDIRKISRFFPSSKTCSGCGFVKDDLVLKDRVFACPVCGLEIDRDYNAAVNIHSVGMNTELNRTLMGAVTIPREASISNKHTQSLGNLTDNH